MGDPPRNLPGTTSELAKYLVRGISWLMVFRALSLGIGLVINIIMARLLLASGYGVYTFVITLVNILVVPALFGFVPLIVRETARHHLGGNWPELAAIVGKVRFRLVSFSVLLAFLSALAAGFLLRGNMEVYNHVFLLGIMLLPLIVFLQLNGSILRGLHHVVSSELPEFLFRRILFLLVLIAVYIQVEQVEAENIMMLYLGVSFLALVFSSYLLRSKLPAEIRDGIVVDPEINWLRASIPFFMLNGISLINQHTDTLMLGALESSALVGVYQAAVRSAGVVVMLLSVVNMVIQPSIVTLHNSGDTIRLQRLVTLSTRGVFFVAVSCLVALAVFGEYLLSLFGHEFGAARNAMLILAGGHVVNAFSGTVGMLLSMTGRESEALYGVSIGATVNIALNLILIPTYGIEGAAVATTTSTVVWTTILIRLATRKSGIYPTVFGSFLRPQPK